MMQTHQQFWRCESRKLGVKQTKRWQIGTNRRIFPKQIMFIIEISFEVWGVRKVIYLFL